MSLPTCGARRRGLWAAIAILALWPARGVHAQDAAAQERTGREIYQDACVACHGEDGRGASRAAVGFDVPLPDFTDCLFATVEAAEGWEAVVHEGGTVRALDRRMPAFGDALSPREIALVVSHVRTFCKDRRAWPQGDLNFPLALLTEKAFPENETLFRSEFGAGPQRSVTNAVAYERRLGARTMLEVVVPFEAVRSDDAGTNATSPLWARGLGDVAIAAKRVMHHDVDRGTIFSLGEEVALPTGREERGLGSGTTTFETFAALGQRLLRDAFLQVHAGVAIPVSGDAGKETFWRTAMGRTFVQGEYFRTWTPMIEVVGARPLEHGAAAQWDLVPQMQLSLSKRRHVLLGAGVQVPVNERDGRSARVLTYLLWDRYEGGLFDGWR